MAAVDDLYHCRLGTNTGRQVRRDLRYYYEVGEVGNRLLTRNAEQEPAWRYKQLLMFGSSVSHRVFNMACDLDGP